MPPKKRNRKDAGLEKYEEEYRSLADEQLRRALMDVGENPGPIDSSNRDIYIRLLVRKKIKLETDSDTASSTSTSSQTKSSSGTRSGASFTPTKERSSTLKKPVKVGASSSPLIRSPLIASKSFSISPSGKLSASPTLTAKPKVSHSFEIKGLVAATFTPFNNDGEVNLPLITSYVDFLLKQKISHVFVNGSTGESLSLTVAERKAIAEEWMKVAGGRLTVIVHVGTESLKSTCELATHAQDIGAAAIGVMPTTFFKPESIEALVLYLQKVGEAAPTTPMYYYHIPVRTGVSLNMEELVEKASTELPTLRGLKFTDGDLMQLSRLGEFEGGKYNLMYGSDQQLLAAMTMGVSAAVGSTYNYCGLLNNRLIKAFNEGDLERALTEQRRSQAAINLLHRYGGISAGKSFMKLRGLDVGPPRLPLLPLSMDDCMSLKRELHSIGFLDWA